MFGRLFYRTMSTVKGNRRVGIVGVPFEKGQVKTGVGRGPAAIRDADLIERIRSIDGSFDVVDYGDVNYEVDKNLSKAVENMLQYEHVASCNEAISKKVFEVIKDDRLCVTLGGDHSLGVGSVDGHVRATDNNVSVLWVDAHGDLNTNKTSSTGNVHGMPLALLVKELSDYWPYLPGMDWQKPLLNLRHVAYIGLRDVDVYERLMIDELNITAYSMDDIDKHGIHDVVHMALEKIDPLESRSLHVSFDIDSLDPLEAPSTGTPVRGGLSLREGLHIMETVAGTGRLGAVDLVEVNPSIGSKTDVKHTVEAAVNVILASLGSKRRGLRLKHATEIPK